LENPTFNDKLKHIEIKYHFIQDMVQRGAMKLQYISIDEEIVNILTKHLFRENFVYFGDKLGMM